MNLQLLAQYSDTELVTTTTTSTGAGIGMGLMLVYLAIAVIAIVALWKTFVKAGQPGWGAIIPIYNIYLILKIAGRPGWWLLLYLIPIVSLVVHIVVSIDVAKGFGKSTTFGVVGLWLFSLIGFLMLGFGDAKYVGAPKH